LLNFLEMWYFYKKIKNFSKNLTILLKTLNFFENLTNFFKRWHFEFDNLFRGLTTFLNLTIFQNLTSFWKIWQFFLKFDKSLKKLTIFLEINNVSINLTVFITLIIFLRIWFYLICNLELNLLYHQRTSSQSVRKTVKIWKKIIGIFRQSFQNSTNF
jgi:hypothetical protein